MNVAFSVVETSAKLNTILGTSFLAYRITNNLSDLIRLQQFPMQNHSAWGAARSGTGGSKG
ncbi:hypothetical protein SBA1_710017 [Candidatus Sulfotelmatobacter kueseliae]|uniref:Uncharacterized protein n=1 Tax=Candidatus Sulfotelmatobacter kueseliae TaxID=2042962 RepID=A0A2U3L5H2_9BACT|nr:hypothetical protein SBA1_710017 [Candidatus Sulfotelmatobacter kueseliae]